MTDMLRLVLVLAAVLVFVLVVRKIRNSQVRLEDSLFWLLLAIALLVVSFVPQIFDMLAALAGVYSTANFVFLFCIFVLLLKCLTMGIRISQLDTRVKELTQYLAIEKFERRMNDEGLVTGQGLECKSDAETEVASDSEVDTSPTEPAKPTE